MRFCPTSRAAAQGRVVCATRRRSRLLPVRQQLLRFPPRGANALLPQLLRRHVDEGAVEVGLPPSLVPRPLPRMVEVGQVVPQQGAAEAAQREVAVQQVQHHLVVVGGELRVRCLAGAFEAGAPKRASSVSSGMSMSAVRQKSGRFLLTTRPPLLPSGTTLSGAGGLPASSMRAPTRSGAARSGQMKMCAYLAVVAGEA